jgi:uncharacterized protein
MIVPLFPLPAAFLFPGTLMPLHVFEPRYRAMVDDLLDTAGRLVVGSVADAHRDELAGAPPVDRVAGLGEIVRHESLPDGRYIIVLHGLGRVICQEAPSEHAYRLVETEPLVEELPSDEDALHLREAVLEAVKARSENETGLPEDLDLRAMTDLLLMQLRLPQALMSDLFSETRIAERARGALEQHQNQG